MIRTSWPFLSDILRFVTSSFSMAVGHKLLFQRRSSHFLLHFSKKTWFSWSDHAEFSHCVSSLVLNRLRISVFMLHPDNSGYFQQNRAKVFCVSKWKWQKWAEFRTHGFALNSISHQRKWHDDRSGILNNPSRFRFSPLGLSINYVILREGGLREGLRTGYAFRGRVRPGDDVLEFCQISIMARKVSAWLRTRIFGKNWSIFN